MPDLVARQPEGADEVTRWVGIRGLGELGVGGVPVAEHQQRHGRVDGRDGQVVPGAGSAQVPAAVRAVSSAALGSIPARASARLSKASTDARLLRAPGDDLGDLLAVAGNAARRCAATVRCRALRSRRDRVP
jgi:hypothetical protein